jgi:hypothetical protein
MNAHVACAREKLASHPTGKIWTTDYYIWTMFKNTVLEKKNIRSAERERKKQKFAI